MVAEIKVINPQFMDYELFPEGGVAGLSWDGRANLIDDLLMQRASALYRCRGDEKQLQIETLRSMYNNYNIIFGKGENILIDNRDYDTSSARPIHRRPDLRIGNIAFDWTIGAKTEKTNQVRGFFAADSKPIGVVIILPTQIYRDGAYYIPRQPNIGNYIYVPENYALHP